MKNYFEILDSLKKKIRDARHKAVLYVNGEMLSLYREIGKIIVDLENEQGWGAKVVEKLSADLRAEFKEMQGLSPRNLRYMKMFYKSYPNFPFLQPQLQNSDNETNTISSETILQGSLAKLPWYHHITLIDKVKDLKIREFYIEQTLENGWTRDVLVNQIEGKLYERQGRLVSNFTKTIPSQQSELVNQLFKDPYKFDFVYLGKEAKERDLEDSLTSQLSNFLVELGKWFAFLGRQYRMVVGEKEYFLDLLFYHTKLKRYIVIDLKIGEFKPEDAGKMQFYLTAADKQLKSEGDDDSIGLILCKTKDGLIAEYALLDSTKPVGIAEYKFNELLPDGIKGELPEIGEIEQRLVDELNELKSPIEKKVGQLKEKLASLNNPEITTPATKVLLDEIFNLSMRPLYENLIKKLDFFFKDEFINVSFGWHGSFPSISSFEELDNKWKDDTTLPATREVKFVYRLGGLKKAGVNGYDIVVGVDFTMDVYWYNISIVNHDNGRPIIKSPYNVQLGQKAIDEVCEIICDQIISRIEYQVGLSN